MITSDIAMKMLQAHFMAWKLSLSVLTGQH